MYIFLFCVHHHQIITLFLLYKYTFGFHSGSKRGIRLRITVVLMFFSKIFLNSNLNININLIRNNNSLVSK